MSVECGKSSRFSGATNTGWNAICFSLYMNVLPPDSGSDQFQPEEHSFYHSLSYIILLDMVLSLSMQIKYIDTIKIETKG